MIDLGLVGGRFTWVRGSDNGGRVWKKLDHGVRGCEWHLAFQDTVVDILGCFHSDHHSLLLRYGSLPPPTSTRLFWYQAMWESHLDPCVVHEAWHVPRVELGRKLQGLQKKAIHFNAKCFGDLFSKKRLLEARIHRLQRQLEEIAS